MFCLFNVAPLPVNFSRSTVDFGEQPGLAGSLAKSYRLVKSCQRRLTVVSRLCDRGSKPQGKGLLYSPVSVSRTRQDFPVFLLSGIELSQTDQCIDTKIFRGKLITGILSISCDFDCIVEIREGLLIHFRFHQSICEDRQEPNLGTGVAGLCCCRQRGANVLAGRFEVSVVERCDA